VAKRRTCDASFVTRNVNTNFKLIVEPLDGLKLNLQSGIDYRTDDNTISASPTRYTSE